MRVTMARKRREEQCMVEEREGRGERGGRWAERWVFGCLTRPARERDTVGREGGIIGGWEGRGCSGWELSRNKETASVI